MKKAIIILITASAFGLSIASAGEFSQPADTTLHPSYLSCDSQSLGSEQDCITTGTTCPPGFVDAGANYCLNSIHPQLQRCGTVCQSIYKGH